MYNEFSWDSELSLCVNLNSQLPIMHSWWSKVTNKTYFNWMMKIWQHFGFIYCFEYLIDAIYSWYQNDITMTSQWYHSDITLIFMINCQNSSLNVFHLKGILKISFQVRYWIENKADHWMNVIPHHKLWPIFMQCLIKC